MSGLPFAAPPDWGQERLGNLSWVRARLGWKGLTADEYVDYGVPMLATPNIKSTELDLANANRITQQRYDESPEIKLREGDVLLTKDGSTIGIANVVRELAEPATVNGSIAVITPTPRLDSTFLLWMLRSDPYQKLMRSLQDGMGVPHLFQSDIKRMTVPVPSVSEQRAIADYLDRETARIDAFIAKNEELIALLAERRTAAISGHLSAAAKGARREKLGHTCRLGNGSTPRRDNARYWEGGSFPWLNSSVVNMGRVHTADQFVTDQALAECHLPLVQPGAILVGLTGEGRTRGMATIVDIKATVNQHLAFIQPDRARWNPEYLVWLLRSMYAELRDASDANGATKGGLTVEQLRAVRVVRPSLSDQARVAKAIVAQTAKMAAAVAVARDSVTLARERRAALISAAVTGKIDVGVAA